MAHVPVMLDAVIDMLRPRSGGRYLDATIGGGGHSEAILAASEPDGRLIGTDADASAISATADRLSRFGPRALLRQAWLDAAAGVAQAEGFTPLDGILVDLGLSSNQLDDPERGLSFMRDGPLDMRFDRTRGITAAELIRECDVAELTRILREYGEVVHARRIAEAIWAARPMTTTSQLSQVVENAERPQGHRPRPGSRPGSRTIHPATQVFQALRIAVNDELRRLTDALPGLIDALAAGGRLAVITFHSLEDRIVKTTFREASGGPDGEDDPAPGFGLPVDRPAPSVRLVHKKPILPHEDEVRQNPRARSAKLRVVERIHVA